MLVVPVLLVFAGLAVGAHRQRDQVPLLWLESRQAAVAAAVAVPLYVGFLVWTIWNGVSPAALTTATLFLVGLFQLLNALSDRGRTYLVGWAVATMLAGFFAPLSTYSNAGIVVGGWLLLGGLSTAGLVAWQLRKGRGPDDH
jgi:hypothetical protein